MMRVSKRALRVGVALSALMGAAGSAHAAEAPAVEAARVEEIVVTAQKRTETLQEVPMAVTAVTGRSLIEAGVVRFQDYAVRVPNLAFAYSSSLGANAQAIAIRGIYGQNTTGMYLDDTPLPMSVDPRVLDLDRIEVLKGPQGTLYGARSMGGTVRLITHQPNVAAEEGYLHAAASATAHGGANGVVDGAINLPLIPDRLAVRASAFYDRQAGVYDRVAAPAAPVKYATEEDVDSSRQYGVSVAATGFLLDGKLQVTPHYLYQRKEQDGHPYADVSPHNFVQQRLFNIEEDGADAFQLYGVNLSYETPIGDFTSNTSGFLRHDHDTEDSSEVVALVLGTPATPVPFHVHGRYRAVSQEARFTSKLEGPFQITAGAFYQHGNNLVVFPPTPVGTFLDNIFNQTLETKITEAAVFGEATYDLTDKLRLIAGARWFDNKVGFNGSEGGIAVTPGVFVGTQRQKGINPKFGVQYRLTQEDMVYATAAKGFRIGGVNSFADNLCAADLAALGLTPDKARTYASDSLWNYELGVKTSWLDHRVTANAAVFDIEWSNVQQFVALPHCGFGISLNGGKARSRGGELELQAAVTPALKLSMGAGYDDAKLTDPGQNAIIAAGTRVQQVPKWTFNAAADYTFELGELPAFLHGDYAYVGNSFSGNNDAQHPRLRKSYALANLRAGVRLERWELALAVQNIFDRQANFADVPPEAIELPGRPRIAVNRPRTLAVDMRVAF